MIKKLFVVFIALVTSSISIAQPVYTSNSTSPYFIPVESSSLSSAGSAAFAAHIGQPGGQTLCLPQSANRPVFYKGPQLVGSRYFWTYACDQETNAGNPIASIDQGGCPHPFNRQADGSCSLDCPEGKPFDAATQSCNEPPDCECDRTPNPIDIVGGEKHKNIVVYSSQGSFPLKAEFHYNNLGNLVRTSAGLGEDASSPGSGGGGSGTTHTTAPLANDWDRDVSYSPILPDPTNALTEYNGNIHRKWRSYYDRYLLAAFELPGFEDETDTPELVRVYRYDGDVENYTLDVGSGTYLPANGYGSLIERLAIGDPLAPAGWKVVNASNEIEIYTIYGKLLQITSSTGLTHTLQYDTATEIQLEQVQDDFGHVLQFHYDDVTDPTLLTKITDPDGNDYELSYTTRGMISSITYPDLTPSNPADNPTLQYLYQNVDFPDALTDIIDENGVTTQHYEYDVAGRAVLSELAGGAESVSIVYDTVNGERTLTDALGLQTTYYLNGDSLFSSVERQSTGSSLVPLATQSFTYDGNNNRASITDWNGNLTTFVRDDRGLETSRIEAVGTPEERTISTTWHAELQLPKKVVEPGRATDFVYDANGSLLSRTETDTTSQSVPYSTNGRTRTWTFTYYPSGVNGQFLMATQDGPRTDISDTTTFTYTAEGFISTVTNPLGHVSQVTSYNARGLPLSMIDSNNVTTSMTYHPRGWLLTSTVHDPVSSASDATTTNEYDDVGQLTKVILPNGAFLSYEYDAAHRLTAIANNLGERQEFTLDAMGNITAESTKDASGNIKRTQTRIFDELSRIHQAIGGENQLTQFGYDNKGNQSENQRDPAGINQVTLQVFDALDRLTTVTDALSNDSDFTYDARDNLTSVTDQRGLTTTYVYDGLNNLIQLVSPDTGTTIYTFDDAGNQLSQVDARGVVTNNTYDALNRLTSVSYPASPTEDITYVYDQSSGAFGIGRLTQLNDQTGETAYVYDHRGNQVESAVILQGNNYSTLYAYDLADNLVQTTYPSGRVVDHQLDSLGRTSGITTAPSSSDPAETIAANVDYLPFGPMTALEYGNNLALRMTNDQDYRVTGINVEDIAATNPDVLGLIYTQNAVDNITSITDNVDTDESQTFLYDLLNRLQDADGDYGDQSYSYDPVGNRLSLTTVKDGNTIVETYTYDTISNRLLSVDEDGVVRTLQYDSNGNVINDDRGGGTGFTLEYNDQNRLKQATPQGAP